MFQTFDSLEVKIDAREKCLIQYFRKESGIERIPPDRQLWSLCNKQSTKPTSEINQLVKAGLITKRQYYGVDRDIRNIRNNKRNHPTAHWFHGEWNVILRKNKTLFRPALIFLDSTSMAGTSSLLQTVQKTMLMCPPGTFLFINLMLNNPRDPKVCYAPVSFMKKLYAAMHPDILRRWTYPGKCFVYNATGYTKMATYPLWRKP